MTRILECHDSELVERARVALNEAGLAFSLNSTDEDGMIRWQIEVSDDDSVTGAAAIERVAQALESERSFMRCNQCGIGMLAVDPPAEEAGAETLFLAYRCPKCGAPGLSSIT